MRPSIFTEKARRQRGQRDYLSGTGRLQIVPRRFTVEGGVEYDLLTKSAWLREEAWGATDPAEQLRQLDANQADVAAYVSQRFQVAYDDARCTPTASSAPGRTERDGRGYAVPPSYWI